MKLPDSRTLGYAAFGDMEGRPLLYFHGGLSSRLDIAFGAEEFARRKIKVLAPDRPGIGISDRQPKRTLLDWCADVRHFLTALGITSCPLLAWSVAGPYAFACAHQLPDLITKVGTIGSAPPMEYPNAIEELGLLIDRILVRCPQSMEGLLAASLTATARMPRPILRWHIESEVSSEADRKVIKAMTLEQSTDFVIESVRQGGAGIVDDYKALVRPWGFSIKEIQKPVFLWYGEEDKILHLKAQQYIAANIPGAVLTLVPTEGHFLLHHKLAEVLRTLCD